MTALIDDLAVVRRIREHLGRWACEPAERGPSGEAPDWPRNAVIPNTDHPVHDRDLDRRSMPDVGSIAAAPFVRVVPMCASTAGAG